MALAHSEVDADSLESSELYANVLSRIANFDIKDTKEDYGPRAHFNRRGAVSSLVFGKKEIKIDNGFWELTDEISKLYLWELKEACADCKLPSVSDINKEVRALVAQGWASKATIGLGTVIVERYGLEFANLAFRYSFLSGILKVVGELVEDSLLVIFHLPGAHFLCEVITFYIAAYSRTVSTSLRSLYLPSYYKGSRILSSARMMATSHVVRRTLRRIDVEIPSFTIHDKELNEFLEQNEETRLSDKFLDYAAHKLENSDRTRPVSEKFEDILKSRHRFNKFLALLEKRIESKKRKLQKGSLSPEQKEIAISDLSVMLQIKKNAFEGKRYKRFLFLKKRKKRNSIGEFTASSKVLKGSEFWFFSLKNDLLMPHLNFDQQRSSIPSSIPRRSPREDALSLWQSRHVKSEAGRKFFIHNLNTIEDILNPKLKRPERYFNFKLLDSFLTTVLSKMALNVLDFKINELNYNRGNLSDASKVWTTKFKIYKRLSKFIGQIDLYTDVLRYGAVNTKSLDVTNPLHAKEYFKQILEIFDFISTFSSISSPEEIVKFNIDFTERLYNLKSSRYWVEKKRRNFSFGAITGVYTCEALY